MSAQRTNTVDGLKRDSNDCLHDIGEKRSIASGGRGNILGGKYTLVLHEVSRAEYPPSITSQQRRWKRNRGIEASRRQGVNASRINASRRAEFYPPTLKPEFLPTSKCASPLLTSDGLTIASPTQIMQRLRPGAQSHALRRPQQQQLRKQVCSSGAAEILGPADKGQQSLGREESWEQVRVRD